MATNRSRRLRKKLRIDEFQEIGFTVNFDFKEGTSVEDIDQVIEQFIREAIEPNGLVFAGNGYLNWEGIIALQKIGKATEEQRQLVQKWLEQNGLTNVTTSELFDIWWQ